MGAFNWIDIRDKCPKCGEHAEIHCQTHIASDFDGDLRGRFHDRHYRLNQAMWWWDFNHEKHDDWRVDGNRGGGRSEAGYDEECCYSTCQSCGAQLYVVIRFRKNVPEKVLGTGLEENWPDEYYK